MKNQFKPVGKLSLKTELSKNEMKQVLGGYSGNQTYCSDGWPTPGSTPIGCQPAYCAGAHHGTFLYCA
jgi:bacteriocin-like protein